MIGPFEKTAQIYTVWTPIKAPKAPPSVHAQIFSVWWRAHVRSEPEIMWARLLDTVDRTEPQERKMIGAPILMSIRNPDERVGDTMVPMPDDFIRGRFGGGVVEMVQHQDNGVETEEPEVVLMIDEAERYAYGVGRAQRLPGHIQPLLTANRIAMPFAIPRIPRLPRS